MPILAIEEFSGGRNTRDAQNAIPKSQSPDCENVWYENNALLKRRGMTVTTISLNNLSPVPEQIKATQLAASNLMRLVIIGKVGPVTRYLVTTDNGTAFAWAGYVVGTCSTAGSSTTVTGAGGTAWSTHIAIGDYFLPAGGLMNRITNVGGAGTITVTSAVTLAGGTSYIILKEIATGSPAGMALFDRSGTQNLFIFDGTHAYRYDGTNVYNATGSPPAGKIVISHKGYLFVLRHNDTDIRWCALRDADTWTAANYQTVTTVGDPTRGAIVYGDAIIIFTRSRMFRFVGDVFNPSAPTYALQEIPVPPNFNFMFSRSAVVHNGVLKFLATDGWYAYSGGNELVKMSDIIQTDVDAFRRLAYAPEAMVDAAVGFIHSGDMYCSVPDNNEVPADQLNCLYVQDDKNAWWKWPTSPLLGSAAGSLSDFALVKFGASGTYQLWAGNVQTNQISRIDVGSSDDVYAITAYWKSREIIMPSDVEFIEAEVLMKKQSAGNLTFSFSVDQRTLVDKTCDMSAGAGNIIRKTIPIGRVGKSLQLKVLNATLAQGFEIYRIEILYQPSEARRT